MCIILFVCCFIFPIHFVPLADQRRHVGDLEAAWLAFPNRAAENAESFQEKRLNEVRLKTAGVGALHVFTDSASLRRIHAVVSQRSLFEKLLTVLAVS